MTQQKKRGLSYVEKPGMSVVVLLDGKTIGHILRNRDGYVYAPKGSTLRGDTFPTIAQVKQTL